MSCNLETRAKFFANVAERDVDLILLEELNVSEEFTMWFCEQIGLQHVVPSGAWHSVVDQWGEADLLLRVEADGMRVAVIIENKIGAAEQPNQAERYVKRGEQQVTKGEADTWRAVIVAPQIWLDALPSNTIWKHQVSYERIEARFRSHGTKRGRWRAEALRAAIDQSRRGYTMVPNEGYTAFHREFWMHLRRNHPSIQMAIPGDKGPESTWIIMRGNGHPPGVQLIWKLSKQSVELSFANCLAEDLWAAGRGWPSDIGVAQTGKSACVFFNAPPVDASQPFKTQIAVVADVLRSAERLLPFGDVLARRA